MLEEYGVCWDAVAENGQVHGPVVRAVLHLHLEVRAAAPSIIVAGGGDDRAAPVARVGDVFGEALVVEPRLLAALRVNAQRSEAPALEV